MRESPFHVTIASSSPTANFDNDLRLVKASLLYADKIKLCSPVSSEAYRYLTVLNGSAKKQLEFVKAFFRQFDEPGFFEKSFGPILEYEKMLQKKHLDRRELLLKIGFEREFKRVFNNLADKVFEVSENLGMKPLISLMESKILEIENLADISSFDHEKIVEKFVEFLERAISDQNTYPLFSDQVGDLVKFGIKAEKITVTESGVARGKHLSLASNLIERLPLFDNAEVNEILDIREELERPLIRFRSSMIKYSSEIKNAPWDKEFPFDAETVFRRDIEPAILDIEDSVKSNNYLSKLVRKAADKPLSIVSGSALGLLMSPLSELPALLTTSMGLAASASLVAYDVYKDWKESVTKTQQNNLFFYYKAKKEFSNLA